MFKIGLVDLDTSHPVAWTPKINAYGDMKIVAVFDSGDVNPRSYTEEFAQKNDVKIAGSLGELAGMVDAVILHGADWDVHVDRAIPFLEAGKPVLIDKPIVGKLRDVHRLLSLQQKHPDALIMGGSSVRFAEEVAALKAEKEAFGQISCAFASGPNDFFSYGIHTVEMFQGFFGTGVKSVRYLGSNGGELFQATYKNGPIVIYQISAPAGGWFFSISTAKGIKTASVDNGKLYDAIIAQFHTMLVEKKAPLPLSDFMEAILIQLAALRSRQTGVTVCLDDLGYDEGFDGKAYTAAYRMNKWKGKY